MDAIEHGIVRTYSLPFGFKATFCWRDAHLDIEWDPHVPRITKPRPWKKFFTAYKAARRDFYQDISATIGGNILIVDTSDLGTEVITAPAKH